MKKKKEFFLWRWLKRMFLGASRELTPENERYDSPGKLAVKRFFRRPAAVISLIGLLSMFVFVFVGPLIDPVDLSYSETDHKNVAPNFNMMSLPSSMKDGIVDISSQGMFTVGVDEEGSIHLWGYYTGQKDKASLKIPEEVKNAKIVHAAAGSDHIVAIDENGKVYAWGQFQNGQYGRDGSMVSMAIQQPDELIDGTIDVQNVRQLAAGKQVTAILMNDGSLYAWGNYSMGATNMNAFRKLDNVEKIVFSASAILGISKDGEFLTGNSSSFSTYETKDGEFVDIFEYIGDRKVVDIAATNVCVALILDDGEIMTIGGTVKSLLNPPEIPDGEKPVSVSAGSRHFTVVTDKGKVYAWGDGKLKQTAVPSALQKEGAVDYVYSAGFQNYAVKDGEFVDSWGLKGYLMGTDELGRDIFNRVMNGGKMTMTIGAVAVIVSSIIGILIGCISGYFGGKVDMFLMRITEIAGSIPFLPFALVLSAILRASDLKEDIRIFIIMVILGLLSWTGLARLVRGQVLAEREKEFVIAAKSMGIRESRIAFKHILPNVISVILVTMTLDFASCMLTESTLSYLGFGVQLPRPTWGNMLNGCNNSIVIQSYWWRWLFPSIFLSFVVICINVIGDTLRDILDPKSEVDR